MRGGTSTSDVDEGIAEFSLKDGTHIDLSRRQVRKKEQIIHLTPAEGRLLRVLIENPGRVYSHRELVLLVQGYDTSQREAPEILRPLVSRLRHKLETFPALSDRIVSVRGTGYLYEGRKVKTFRIEVETINPPDVAGGFICAYKSLLGNQVAAARLNKPCGCMGLGDGVSNQTSRRLMLKPAVPIHCSVVRLSPSNR